MSFVKYQHVERIGSVEVENVLVGICHVFPKIDGTNGSAWLEDGVVKCASRTRELGDGQDNAGFKDYISKDDRFTKFFNTNPDLRLYGEWLVPHSLKTYREDAWRKFYVFDVCDGERYLTYEEYKPILDAFKIDYIPPIKIISNPRVEDIVLCLEQNNFLIKDGCGFGEGVVVKRYDYVSKFGRVTWAKMVTSEFKEKHSKEMGCPIVKRSCVEDDIVNEFVTEAFVLKEKAKIELENGGWSQKLIPKLLGIVFYELVKECSWDIVKKYKQPTVSFKVLNIMTIARIKALCPDIF